MRSVARLGCALIALGAARAALATVCPPAATVHGADDLAAPVRAALRARGIGEGEGACPVARAHLDRQGARVAIELVDAQGRRVEREVADFELAALVIESWVRSDALTLTAVLPMAPPRPSVPARLDPDVLPSTAFEPQMLPGPLETRPTTGFDLPPAGHGAPPAGGWEFALGVQSFGDPDGGSWVGAGVEACRRHGSFCSGLTVRGGVAPRSSIVSGSDIDLLLTTRLQWKKSPFAVAPGLALGVGWMHFRSTAFESTMTCGVDPDGNEICISSEGATAGDRFGIRAEASVAGTLDLSDSLALQFDIGLGVLPGAFQGISRKDSPPNIGVGDPGASDPEQAPNPAWMVRAGLGLRFGM